MVIQIESYTCHISALLKAISDKTISKKALISLENPPFFARRNHDKCPPYMYMIPEMLAPWRSQNTLPIKLATHSFLDMISKLGGPELTIMFTCKS